MNKKKRKNKKSRSKAQLMINCTRDEPLIILKIRRHIYVRKKIRQFIHGFARLLSMRMYLMIRGLMEQTYSIELLITHLFPVSYIQKWYTNHIFIRKLSLYSRECKKLYCARMFIHFGVWLRHLYQVGILFRRLKSNPA